MIVALLESMDHALFWLINRTMHHRSIDAVFEGLSSLGGWTVGLITLTLLAAEGRRSLGRHVLVILVFLTITAVVNRYLKETIDRPRPTVVFASEPADADGPWLRVLELNPPRRNAFPSGHSMTAFFLLVYAGRRKRHFQTGLLILATGIALSRVYVGVHFPADCLAGALVGTLGALLAAATFKRLEKRLWTATRSTTPPNIPIATAPYS